MTSLIVHHTALRLSTRQKEILALIGQGLSDQEIADHLRLSPSTVKTYLSRVYHRYGFKNRAQAALAYATLAPASELAARQKTPDRGWDIQ